MQHPAWPAVSENLRARHAAWILRGYGAQPEGTLRPLAADSVEV